MNYVSRWGGVEDILRKILLELQHISDFYDMASDNFSHSVKQGWESEILAPNTSIPAKSSIFFVRLTDYHGWLKSAFASFSDSSMGIKITVENKQGKQLVDRGTVLDLYTAGLTQANPSGLWVSKFTTGLYVLVFTPPYPGVPFNRLMIELVNDSATAGVVYAASAIMIKHF